MVLFSEKEVTKISELIYIYKKIHAHLIDWKFYAKLYDGMLMFFCTVPASMPMP